MAVALVGASSVAVAAPKQAAKADSAKVVNLQEVEVIATRATSKTPVAFTNVSKSQIEALNKGKDVPFILGSTPSVTTSSDAGTGIGYTGIHVRGTDPTRINVTTNGVPINDAESAQLYWVDMPDLVSSVESIQIQRGVGTSTNGAGAFGATVNMKTESVGGKPYAGFDVTAGSYGTNKEMLKFSTGLLGGHWGVQGRLSHVASDGYIDRATTRLNSYFLQGAYMNDNTVVKAITYNGTERTYMAWDYASKADMKKYGRRYNPSGAYTDTQGNTAYYRNQTDNYHQQFYQLLLDQRLATNWNLNAVLHYTHGNGYYEQFKEDQKLYKYLLTDGLRANLVRRKKMANDFYGAVASVSYDNRDNLSAVLGGGWNKYDGDHYGRLLWMGSPYYWGDNDEKVFVTDAGANSNPSHEYYRNNAKKTDGNIYGKVTWQFAQGLNAFVDLQYRHISYKMSGMSQEFDGDHKQRPMDLDVSYDFFNPKFGLTYNFLDGNTIYASYAIAHKEPVRNDFEDMMAETESVTPHSERLNDLELGYKYQGRNFTAGVNFYWMDYDNQFVLTGAQDSNGEMVARNIKDSYRMGVEMEAAWRPFTGFEWSANCTLSKNRAKHVGLTVINEDWSQTQVQRDGESRLAFSPSCILNNTLSYGIKGFKASLITKYVSEQYMTNSGFKRYLEDDGSYTSAMIDSYCITNLDLSYSFKLRHVKNITLGVTVYNLFNEEYETNGSCSMNFRKTADGSLEAYNGGWAWSTYSAQAPTHVLAHVSFLF